MIQAMESIRRSVVVPVPRERAFEVFTGGMTGWWPSDHHIGSAPIEQIVIEPREGGRWYTRHTDGSETSTGYVAAWEPPDRVVVTWQISAEWKYDPSLVTTVEVRFVAESPERTRVELEHRDLERFGDRAEKVRDSLDSSGGWQGLLDLFEEKLASRG